MDFLNQMSRAEGFRGQRIVVLPGQVVVTALAQPLLKNLVPTDIGYFPRASGHFMKRAVGVDQAIFIYCVKGQGWYEIENSRQEVQSAQLLVVPPGTPHAYGADERHPWTIFWVHVKGDNVGRLLGELGITRTRPVLPLGEDTELLALFEQTLDVLEHGYATSRLLYASHIVQHLIGLMIWDRHRNLTGTRDAAQKVAQSITYMKQHLDQPATAASLAALANLSESHYRSLFKQQTGYAPVDYFIRLRMHKACQLLDTSNLSIKEIGMMVGYEDPYYFSRVFKTVYELAPTEYRLKHKG
jgi:AraC family transcriptional regulator, arabinose operon regulatory protein